MSYLAMCDPCFKTLGPLEELAIGHVLPPAVPACEFCGQMLTEEKWQASHAIRAAGAPPTFQQNMDMVYAAAQLRGFAGPFETDLTAPFEEMLKKYRAVVAAERN